VNALELQELLASGADCYLIHVLPRVSFDKAHILGSQHISFYDDDFLARVEALAPDRRTLLVVYCLSQGCNASARAAATLGDAGYENVHDFEGGVQAWREAGQSVVERIR